MVSGPASATGEDVAEFHVHGRRAVLAALFAALSGFENVRPAEPGEFTRRAFENGKLDLTEAEGLDDLIHADTDRQRRQALRQLKGLLGDRARDWRAQIIEASALIEAGIDFSDEGDVPAELIAPALAKIKALQDEIEEVLGGAGPERTAARRPRGRDCRAAECRQVDADQSLARREVAIVSPHAGTTRDVIEVQLDLDGYPVTVIDTAGIRETDDPVEQEGVRRARARAAEADLVLWLTDGRRRADQHDGLARSGWCETRSISKLGVGHWPIRRGRASFRSRRAGRWVAGADRGAWSVSRRLFWRRRGRADRPKPAAETFAGDGSVATGVCIEVVEAGRRIRRGGTADERPIRWGGCWGGWMSRIFWTSSFGSSALVSNASLTTMFHVKQVPVPLAGCFT